MNILSLEDLWGTDHAAIVASLEALITNSNFSGRNKALINEAHFLLCAVSSLKEYEERLLSYREDLGRSMELAGPLKALFHTIPEASGKSGTEMLSDLVESSAPQTLISKRGAEEYTLDESHVPNDTMQISIATSRRKIQQLESEVLRVNHLIKSHYFTAKAKMLLALEVSIDA